MLLKEGVKVVITRGRKAGMKGVVKRVENGIVFIEINGKEEKYNPRHLFVL